MIAELTRLWEVGLQTYDVSRKQNFQIKTTLLWTISDFHAYSILSGWSTVGKLACPYYIEHSDAFSLNHEEKVSWFDNHRKFLPMDHSFRWNQTNFLKGKVCMFETPPILSSGDTFLLIDDLGLRKVRL